MRDSSGCGEWVESLHRCGAVGGGTDGCEGVSLLSLSLTLMACSYLGLNVVARVWVVVESGGGGALGTTLQFVAKV